LYDDAARRLCVLGQTPAFGEDKASPAGAGYGIGDLDARALRPAGIQPGDDLHDGGGANRLVHVRVRRAERGGHE
jgi:hypothetical protein